MRQQLWNCTLFNHGNVNRVRTRYVSQCTPRLDIYDLHDKIIPYEEVSPVSKCRICCLLLYCLLGQDFKKISSMMVLSVAGMAMAKDAR